MPLILRRRTAWATVIVVELPTVPRRWCEQSSPRSMGRGREGGGLARAVQFHRRCRHPGGLARAVRDALDRVKPDKVSVTLSIEPVVKSGKLTGLIVEGGGTGSLGVTLKWGT